MINLRPGYLEVTGSDIPEPSKAQDLEVPPAALFSYLEVVT